MSLHSPLEYEIQLVSTPSLPSRHSRESGNPRLFSTISPLDTRPRVRGGMLSNRGYDGGTIRSLDVQTSHPNFKGGHEEIIPPLRETLRNVVCGSAELASSCSSP